MENRNDKIKKFMNWYGNALSLDYLENIQSVFDADVEAGEGNLIDVNRIFHVKYRNDLNLVHELYDRAIRLLQNVYGKDDVFELPIDVCDVAEKCGFSIYEEEFRQIKLEERKNAPIAQLQMWRKRDECDKEKVGGVIVVDKELDEDEKRFCVAHELGHFVLREQNPIGRMFVRSACPGAYASIDDVGELVADQFAYALLLPFESYKRVKKEYEEVAFHWPIEIGQWINELSTRAGMPEYRTVLAYQELKKYELSKNREKAMKSVDVSTIKLVDGLRKIGFSMEWISDFLSLDWSTVELCQEVLDFKVVGDDLRKKDQQYTYENLEKEINSLSCEREKLQLSKEKQEILRKKWGKIGLPDRIINKLFEELVG